MAARLLGGKVPGKGLEMDGLFGQNTTDHSVMQKV
jgi:hypothetical protein